MAQPWLFGRRLDLLAFGGSVLIALALVAVGSGVGALDRPLPLGLWLLLVVGVDVAHVHTTWLRTYLDPEAFKAHLGRYLVVPLLCYGVGVVLHAWGSLPFWRLLAYLAVFHFIRQQVGWVALYQREDPRLSERDRALDRLTIYVVTVWPLLWWHAHLPRPFSWFVSGDFAAWIPLWWPELLRPLYLGVMGAWALRQAWLWKRYRTFAAGKGLIVVSTALTWYLGIVHWQSDLAFTALNVLPHGIPYAVLVWTRSQREGKSRGVSGWLLSAGPVVAVATLLMVAFGEEWLWDLGIWHDHPALFGAGWDLSTRAQMWLVPLLALPQSVHYVLDGFIWRRPSRSFTT